eukprot:scaffold17764_cov44-Prasinocladus_malaysianus.AAC.1
MRMSTRPAGGTGVPDVQIVTARGSSVSGSTSELATSATWLQRAVFGQRTSVVCGLTTAAAEVSH